MKYKYNIGDRVWIVSSKKKIGDKWINLFPEGLRIENYLPIEVTIIDRDFEEDPGQEIKLWYKVDPVNQQYMRGSIAVWHVTEDVLYQKELHDFERLFEI